MHGYRFKARQLGKPSQLFVSDAGKSKLKVNHLDIGIRIIADEQANELWTRRRRVAYFFARELVIVIRVPAGLLNVSHNLPLMPNPHENVAQPAKANAEDKREEQERAQAESQPAPGRGGGFG